MLKSGDIFGESRRGQVTIFVIIALIIVAGAVLFFVFKGSFDKSEIPANLEPVYSTFLSCIEENTLVGIDILESQGGYIYLPEYEAGSSYMPFSSQLDFLGNPIPYWYYVSGNNIPKQQVPSKSLMEKQIAEFLESRINDCVFDKYVEEGYAIYLGDSADAKVTINDKDVSVSLNFDFDVEGKNESIIIRNHDVVVQSQLGRLYDSAKKLYNYEMEKMFLENYGVDILRFYAPVDGVELTCSPLVWSAEEVFEELENAIEANTLALKSKGRDYSLKNKENKYFEIELPLDSGFKARFLNSKLWPHSFEVNPAEGAVLVSKPVGNQPGLGALGFCYVPYHFVYDVNYPVLIQIYSDSAEEIFQFPFAVVIKGNRPREPFEVESVQADIFEFCEHKVTPTRVNVYDSDLNPVDAEISYKCVNTICNIGETNDGVLEENFPQCVSGSLVVRADGFREGSVIYSSVNEGSVDVILDRIYDIDTNVFLDGENYNGEVIISFVAEDGASTIVYPSQRSIKLSEGQYEVKVSIYKNASLNLEETTSQQCMEVPQSGLGGLIGLTEKKCFDIVMPAQMISNVLIGGGKQNYYLLESELEESHVVEIYAERLPMPKSIEELQENYMLFENQGLNIIFK